MNARSRIAMALAILALDAAASVRAQAPGVEIVATYRGHGEPVYAVALTPDGSKLVTGGLDAAVRIWDVASAKELRSFAAPMGHTKMVLSTAASLDGRLIATGGADGALKFWDVPREASWTDTGPRIAMLVGGRLPTLPYNAAALARTSGDTLKAAPSAGAVKAIVHPVAIDAVAFHPKNPNVVATAAHDGRVRVIDFVKNGVLKEILAHVSKDSASPVYALAFSPDGTKIASAGYDRSVKLHDSASGAIVREWKPFHAKESPRGHQDEVYAVAFSPDGKWLATGSGGLENAIKIFNVDDGSIVRDLIDPRLPGATADGGPAHPGWVLQLRFLKDGRLIAAGAAPKNRGAISVWRPADGKLLFAETTSFGSILGLAVSDDERTIVVGCGQRGSSAGSFNHAHRLRIPGIEGRAK